MRYSRLHQKEILVVIFTFPDKAHRWCQQCKPVFAGHVCAQQWAQHCEHTTQVALEVICNILYVPYPNNILVTNLDRFSGSICVQATENFPEPTAEQTTFVQCQFVWWIMGLFVPRGTVCLQRCGANVCCNQSSGFSLWSCLRKDCTKDV